MLRALNSSRRIATAVEFAVAEVLESRRLLAAIESGILVARGTDNADTISLRRSGGDDVIVTTNGANQTFDMDDFTGVRLEGLGGNDTFNLIDALTSPVVRNTTVFGGAGSDTVSYATRTAGIRTNGYEEPDAATAVPYIEVISGAQTDRLGNDVETIIGGSGNDSLGADDLANLGTDFDIPSLRFEGRDGDDRFGSPFEMSATLVGGAGNDTFDADESSSDNIQAGEGDDLIVLNNFGIPNSLDAGPGHDTLRANSQRTTIDASGFAGLEDIVDISSAVTLVIGNGLDNFISTLEETNPNLRIVGDAGNDTIVGGSSGERLEGGEGDDSLVGNGGDDTLDGGNGTDFGDGGTGTNTLISIENTQAESSIEISGGTLVAIGTGGADTISVRRTGTDNVIVTVNALSAEFDMDDFPGGIRLEGLGGNDTFNLIDPLTSPVTREVSVRGGSGDDTVSYATRTAPVGFGPQPGEFSATSGGVTDTLHHVETLIGGSGNDSFSYGDNPFLPEEEENNTISFRLEGRGGNDRFVSRWISTSNLKGVTLFGGDGDDFFEQNDLGGRVFAEGGNDTINIRSREANYANFLDGGSGIDLVIGAGGNRSLLDLREYPNIENADLGSFAGVVIGTDSANMIDGSDADAVTINGLGGNDTLVGGSDADSLDGGAGNDVLVGNEGNDTLDGASGTDFADGDGGSNSHISIEQFAGSTPLIAIVGNVLTAYGTGSGETITIERVLSDDVIVRIGSLSRQFDIDDFALVRLLGLGGNDTITVLDPVTAGAITRIVTAEGGGGNDSLTGDSGIDVLRGSSGADTLVGLGGDDTLDGDFGNDRLFGGTGLDFLDGGDNDDFIDSSDSAAGDTVAGGAGNDTADVDAGDSASSIESFV